MEKRTQISVILNYLAFIVSKALAGLAEVAGKPFQSKQKVWDNDLFPFRIPLKFEKRGTFMQSVLRSRPGVGI